MYLGLVLVNVWSEMLVTLISVADVPWSCAGRHLPRHGYPGLLPGSSQQQSHGVLQENDPAGQWDH